MERPSFWTEGFKAVGGNAALDFINTLSERHTAKPVERLCTYADLVSAAGRIGVLAEPQAAALLARAERDPERAEAARRRGIGLREDLHRIFLALAQRREPAKPVLDRFNRALGKALRHLRIDCAQDGRFAWSWDPASPSLDRPLWPLLRAAGELLASGDAHRLRECAAEDCGWLFLDLSRNHRRRWCDMADCGNRAKARRYARRHGR